MGRGFLRKKKLIESLETKNDAFLGVLWTFRDRVEIKDVDNHTFERDGGLGVVSVRRRKKKKKRDYI